MVNAMIVNQTSYNINTNIIINGPIEQHKGAYPDPYPRAKSMTCLPLEV